MSTILKFKNKTFLSVAVLSSPLFSLSGQMPLRSYVVIPAGVMRSRTWTQHATFAWRSSQPYFLWLL